MPACGFWSFEARIDVQEDSDCRKWRSHEGRYVITLIYGRDADEIRSFVRATWSHPPPSRPVGRTFPLYCCPRVHWDAGFEMQLDFSVCFERWKVGVCWVADNFNFQNWKKKRICFSVDMYAGIFMIFVLFIRDSNTKCVKTSSNFHVNYKV